MRAILRVFLVAVCWLPSAQADEQRTFHGKTVEGWREVLRNKTGTAGERQQAVWALGCFGPEAKAAVPDLIEAVRQGQFQDEAIGALVTIGAGTEVAAIPRLIERFLKQGCAHRTRTGGIGYRADVEETLVKIGGPAVPSLLEVLNGPNEDMRLCVASVLGQIGPAARMAVPALIEAIERPDADRQAMILRSHAVQALGGIRPEARAAVPTLNRLFDHALNLSRAEEPYDAFDVATALGQIGAPPVRKLLDTFLRKGDPFMAWQLAWFGPKAREAVPSLRGALTDKRLEVRVHAAVALTYIEPSDVKSIPVLIEGLNHLDDETLYLPHVLQVLARLGPTARPAIPALIGLVKRKCHDPGIHMALVQLDPEGKECVPTLILALDHKDYQVVDVAANCLGLLGPRANDAVPALATVATRNSNEDFDENYDPQVSAAKALRRIGPQARPPIPALIGALKHRRVVRNFDDIEDHDYAAAVAAADVLGSFGAEAKAAIPALIQAIQTREKDEENWPVRQAAIVALGRMGPDAKTAIPVLRKLIKDERKPPQVLPETLATLYQLPTDGKALAEKWLEEPPSGWLGSRPLEGRRAIVLGVMGRTSVEGDWLTRRDLERFDSIFAHADPRETGPSKLIEEWFEHLGRFGVGGRLAIPRLNEFRKHPNPWVRMWASEALTRIMPKG